MIAKGAAMTMQARDFDSHSRVSEQTAVVRWGRSWYAFVTDNEGDSATTGPAHPSKAVAIAYALRLVERGDYR